MKFLLLLIPFLAFSQAQVAKGFILDRETNALIPYVNISILESKIGTSSDDDGSYSLNIITEDLNKEVKLSSLGYKDTTYVVSKFMKLKTVQLIPIALELDEVVISEKFEQKTRIINEIDEEDLCAGYGSSQENPWLLGLYFPYKKDYKDTDFLKSIRFHFGNFKNKKAKFRLRLLSIGQDGLPEKDLLKENVIVSLKKKQRIVDIDISNYDIIFPRDGFYIAFEWLYIPYNAEVVTFHFGKKNKKKEKRTRYNPTFSATCEEKGQFKIVVYNSGTWKHYPAKAYKREGQWVPAISLTLSN